MSTEAKKPLTLEITPPNNLLNNTSNSNNELESSTNQAGDEKGPSPRNGVKKKKHKKINREHPEFELTYDMMVGLRTTVGRVSSRPMRKVTNADFSETTKLRFPSEGSSLTPAHNMRDFKFKDYAPEVFRHIRERFGIDGADYMIRVCGNFEYLEFISNSKSGQFFFYTYDRQFMIKTVSQGECKYLRRILPDYYKVRNN
jgi:1-phosphatidylinositol-4-phosphate 5-kinase